MADGDYLSSFTRMICGTTFLSYGHASPNTKNDGSHRPIGNFAVVSGAMCSRYCSSSAALTAARMTQ
ncbi:MAG TPA: hypothetical protein VGY58_11585, partial [Gemmataceae bacterium]|nr:hypothetical protein [Gemmataceae bacterium]